MGQLKSYDLQHILDGSGITGEVEAHDNKPSAVGNTRMVHFTVCEAPGIRYHLLPIIQETLYTCWSILRRRRGCARQLGCRLCLPIFQN